MKIKYNFKPGDPYITREKWRFATPEEIAFAKSKGIVYNKEETRKINNMNKRKISIVLLFIVILTYSLYLYSYQGSAPMQMKNWLELLLLESLIQYLFYLKTHENKI